MQRYQQTSERYKKNKKRGTSQPLFPIFNLNLNYEKI